MGQSQVDEGKVGQVFLGGGNSAVEVVGGRDNPVTRIIFDKIFQCRRKLDIVLDDQDLQHLPRPPVLPRKILVLERDGA
jgi:hypothetical protein